MSNRLNKTAVLDARCSGWTLSPEPSTGDAWLTWFPKPRRLGFAIADACGHGVLACQLLADLDEAAKHEDLMHASPAEAINTLNRLFWDRVYAGDGRFITLLFGSVDLTTGDMVFANAGHPPPVLLRRKEARVVEHGGGFPLGVVKDGTWTNTVEPLASGDRLILYTDGVIETPVSGSGPLGVQELVRFIQQFGGETRSLGTPASVSAALHDLVVHAQLDGRLRDDATCVEIEFL